MLKTYLTLCEVNALINVAYDPTNHSLVGAGHVKLFYLSEQTIELIVIDKLLPHINRLETLAQGFNEGTKPAEIVNVGCAFPKLLYKRKIL